MWIHEYLVIKHTLRRYVTLSRPVNSCQCFETMYCRRLQGHASSESWNWSSRSDNEVTTILRTAGNYLPVEAAKCFRRLESSATPLRAHQILISASGPEYAVLWMEFRNTTIHSPREPPPPLPVNSPFMILENDLPACYNLQKKKKLWVVEETVKGERAIRWDYCMQSKLECVLPPGRIFRPCEKQWKRVETDRNNGEWIAVHYKEIGCAYSWQEGDCTTSNTSAINSSSTMSPSKRFKKDNLQHNTNAVLQQNQ
jgi:hypothetical protein